MCCGRRMGRIGGGWPLRRRRFRRDSGIRWWRIRWRMFMMWRRWVVAPVRGYRVLAGGEGAGDADDDGGEWRGRGAVV